MDWPLAIERNREALLRIVVTLFAMLGLAEGDTLGRISRFRNNAVLRILRLAEAAVRRLIVAAAKGMVAKPRPSRPFPEGKTIPKGTSKSKRAPAFKLSDKHEPWLPPASKRKPKTPGPRISVLGDERDFSDWSYPDLMVEQLAALRAAQAASQPEPARKARPGRKPNHDGKVDGARLADRLRAIKAALEDIPRQAKRYLRWKATRERQADEGKRVHTSTLREFIRSGIHDLPSYRDPPIPKDLLRHEAETLRDECDWLAREAMKIDTS